jgi:hypothetical protein
MAYKLIYTNGTVGGEIEKPDAHSALQQIMYLERDGFDRIIILDPQGTEIGHDQLGRIALRSLSASPNA